jgi:calreticulin
MFFLFSFARGTIYFREDFDDFSLERWQRPERVRKGVQLGKVRASTGDFYGDEQKWRGMETMDSYRYYYLTSNFSKVMDTRNTDLVLQYTVRMNYHVDCSGQYIKLLDKDTDIASFSNATKYEVMFGPDICGSTLRKLHVILCYKGQEYPTLKPINCIKDHLTHSYTLIIRKNNTFQVDIDGETVDEATLAERFDIPEDDVVAPEKPADWDDDEYIIDVNDKKPDDWEDDEYIPDPHAVKPFDWDDSIHPWEPGLIRNPKYKGEWKQRMIKNPNYKGVWQPHVEIFGHFNALKYLGIEFYQNCPGSHFDNFLVSDDEHEAREILEENFLKWRVAEVQSFDTKNERAAKAEQLENIRREKEMDDHHDPDTFEDGKGESEEDYFKARRAQAKRHSRKYQKGQFDQL